MYINVQTYTIQTAVPSLERPPPPPPFVHLQNSTLWCLILSRHLSSKSPKFVLYWYNVGQIHVCGWTNIFAVGPALIQHVLTVMYCICWAFAGLIIVSVIHTTSARCSWETHVLGNTSSVYDSASHMIAMSHDLNVQSEKSFHICRS